MLVYIIDGWNVVHRLNEIRTSSQPRQALLKYIKQRRLTGSRNNKVIVVFDGFFPLEEIQSEREYRLMFSGEKQADTVIIEQLKKEKNPKQAVVVSDDREIVREARLAGAGTMKVEEFIALKPVRKDKDQEERKNIKYSDQREITEELRKIWLKGTGDSV